MAVIFIFMIGSVMPRYEMGVCAECGEETLINKETELCESCTAEDDRDSSNYGSEDEVWNYPG